MNRENPRWIAKPTVAYLWASTVTCKQCRATLPLLKTRWICKKDRKRVLLTMQPDGDRSGGVVFGVEVDAPQIGGNAAQRREHDRRIGAATMSRTGATCPCCGTIMTMQDIRLEGRSGRLAATMTAVVVDGPKSKEYRLPTDHEREVAQVTEERLQALYSEIPFGLPEEPLPGKETLGFRVPLYGLDTWRKLFTNRQLLALGAFVRTLREMNKQLADCPSDWAESLIAMCLPIISRMADRAVHWRHGPTIPKKSGVRLHGSRYRLHGISPSLHRFQTPREDSYNPSIGCSRSASICKKRRFSPKR